MSIRRFSQGNANTIIRMNELVDAVNSLNNVVGDGLIKVKRTNSGYTLSLNMDGVNARVIKQRSGGGTQVRRAKIQTSGVGTTSLSCKLLDSSGTETGDAITVYPVEHLGTNNLSGNVWPKLAATDNIPIFQDVNGTWYTTFIFDDTSACS